MLLVQPTVREPAAGALVPLRPLPGLAPAHHRSHLLTLPEDDPESYYFSPHRWQHLSGWRRTVIHLRNTFIGRLLLSPLLDIGQLLAGMVRAFRQRQGKTITMWIVHMALLAVVFIWLACCDFPALWYVLMVSYPALAITKIRSFLEHRWQTIRWRVR